MEQKIELKNVNFDDYFLGDFVYINFRTLAWDFPAF